MTLPPELEALTTEYTDGEYATIYSRMRECGDRGDRARVALTILLQHLESFAGYLYGVTQEGVTLLAGLPDFQPEPELDDWLQRWAAAEIASLIGEVATSDDDDAQGETSLPNRYTDRDGRRFAPVSLFGKSGFETRLAGVLVMHMARPDHGLRHREVGGRVAIQLLEHGDVEGVAVSEARTQTR